MLTACVSLEHLEHHYIGIVSNGGLHGNPAKMNTDAHSLSHTQVVPLSIKSSSLVDWTCFACKLVLLCKALFSFEQCWIQTYSSMLCLGTSLLEDDGVDHDWLVLLYCQPPA